MSMCQAHIAGCPRARELGYGSSGSSWKGSLIAFVVTVALIIVCAVWVIGFFRQLK
jgi:hypothetical protein